VTAFATQVVGTQAYIKEGDELSYMDLLHGLMLPSGNDAALLIAEYFGNILKERKYSRPGSQK